MKNYQQNSQKLNSIEAYSSLKFKSFKSRSLKIITNNNNNYRYNNIKSKNKNIPRTQTSSKTINIGDKDNLKKSKINRSLINKNNKANKNTLSYFNFSKFDSQNMAYDIDKTLSKSTNFKGKSFLSRMQMDIKYRQTKEERRKNLLNEYKPKEKEEERIKCFNRLINDSNKRNKIKENIERQNEFLSPGFFPKKMSKKKWDIIYENRFYNYQEKKDYNLREKIIEKEKIVKQKEEEIIEQINASVKKVNKKDLERIINRLYLDPKKKEIKKKMDNIISSDKDKANGMKKEEKNDQKYNNINTNIDNTYSISIRDQKQHHTIKSTKLREKKNSYFGSVIIKTSTFQQGKTNSLIKFIQNFGKSENKLEKRHTIQSAEKEIKEIENENVNVSYLNKINTSNNNINSINNNNVNIKKHKSDKHQKSKSISNIWANDIQIKKSQSLKRILVNDFNCQNMKFNINSNYINKNEKKAKIKKVNNGLNIINSEYYQNIDEDDDESELKINDINVNEFMINDLKNNMKEKKKYKYNDNRHFNSPINKNNNNNKNLFSTYKNNNKNTRIFDDKNIKGNNKRFIDEISAMKIVEDIFVNKIKEK